MKYLGLLVLGISSLFGLLMIPPVNAATACMAPYQGDPNYESEYAAFVNCQTDNYNESQCEQIAPSASSTYSWNASTHECQAKCNAGYYASVSDAGTYCSGTGLSSTSTPDEVLIHNEIPGTSDQIQTAVPVTVAQSVATTTIIKTVSTPQVTTKTVIEVATETPQPVQAANSAPTAATTTDVAAVPVSQPSFLARIWDYFIGLF